VLLAATHAKNDMPSELLALQQEHPDTSFHFGAAMDLHPRLLELCRLRIIEAEARSPRTVARGDSCLVVVGRGTTDPDANSEIAKLTRMLEEGMGFGASFVCYSGTARPLVADGLKAASLLGFERIVVLPYFLFDGVLVKRIYGAVDDLAARCPDIEVLAAPYLGVHEQVAEVFLERAGRRGRPRQHELRAVQIPGADHRLRTASGHAATRPSRQGARPAGQGQQPCRRPAWPPYVPHPIEAESMRIIREGRDWSAFPAEQHTALHRLVHTTGDFSSVDELFSRPARPTSACAPCCAAAASSPMSPWWKPASSARCCNSWKWKPGAACTTRKPICWPRPTASPALPPASAAPGKSLAMT
jgi:precorrin-8X/cobalt-precorrin-8 methylmutase